VLVWEVLNCQPGIAAECRTVFQPNELMFAGHFPGDPIVPGVILAEALAQTAGIAAERASPRKSRSPFLLSGIRQMKFFQAVRPGDQIMLRATKSGELNNCLQFSVEAIVNGKQVAAGEIALSAREMTND
jgi:3-hydroxyacyl-[acyl-carrier-protein] dehydratase